MKMKMMFTALLVATALFGKEFQIAQSGKTEYNIVIIGEKNEINDFAGEELSYFLRKATGAEFKVSKTAAAKSFFIGAQEATKASLQDQAYVIETKDTSIYLYGKGKHGNLYAVYEYLERIIGIRWFSAYGDIKIPTLPELKHQDLHIIGNYPFRVRSTQTFFYRKNPGAAALFHYRNRQNMLLTESSGIRCLELEYQPNVHTLTKYIHPGENYFGEHEKRGRIHKQFDWIENKNYFTTNPEWFPMDKDGKRYTHGQLCFSNLEMRRELFKNVFSQVEKEVERTGIETGIFTLDQTDINYEEFCYCPECRKLNEKYQSKGGAFFEMLFTFNQELQKRYPKMRLKTLGYFHTLTAPVDLPIPNNLILIFCPIYANYLAPLELDEKLTFLTLLKKWTDQSARVWYWYYTLPYREDQVYLFLPPIANLARYSADIKTLRNNQVDGTYFEHDSGGTDRTNFFELQSYLLLRLFQNPEQDIENIVVEFTDFYYGAAAPLFRKYLYEIEGLNREVAKKGTRAVYNTLYFSYMTNQNFQKWKQWFEEMENLVTDTPECLFHVRLARLGMDAATVSEAAKTASWAEVEPMADKVQEQIQWLVDTQQYPFAMDRITKWKIALKEISDQN